MRFAALLLAGTFMLAAADVARAVDEKSADCALQIAAFGEHLRWDHYGGVLSIVGGFLGFIISTSFVLKQMRDTQRWNVRKSSDEMLTALITGDFPRLMDRLILEFGWDILRHTPYSVIAKEKSEHLLEVNITLRNVLRHLEVICINMKNGIVDEEICFDYLRSILTTFYVNCDSFILDERERRKESHIFTEVERYAKKWLALIDQERRGTPYRVYRKGFIKIR